MCYSETHLKKILERKTSRQDVNNIKIRSTRNNTKEIASEQGNGHQPVTLPMIEK